MKTTKMLVALVLRSEALLRKVVLVLALGLSTEVAKADFTFGTPANLGQTVNSSDCEYTPSLSTDGFTLYFCPVQNSQPATFDIWQAPFEQVVDFNGDGIINSADVCIMIDYWGENYPLCDIGPTPFGDS